MLVRKKDKKMFFNYRFIYSVSIFIV